jgi:hypothetical protein
MSSARTADPDATAIRAAGTCNTGGYRVQAYVDGTGVGAGVAPRMQRLGVSAVSVKVASAPTYKTENGDFFQMRDQLWWSAREWLRDEPNHPSFAMLPSDDDLIEELSAPLYTIKGGRICVTDKDTMREMLGRSPDKADSLCLTFADDAAGASLIIGKNPLAGYRG